MRRNYILTTEDGCIVNVEKDSEGDINISISGRLVAYIRASTDIFVIRKDALKGVGIDIRIVEES